MAIYSVSVLGQIPETFKCDEGKYTFSGIPEPTLCKQFSSNEFTIKIGAGTAYPKSSLLGNAFGGNVCIVGDFEVDAPFVFKDAILNIKSGVKITVKGSPNSFDPGSWLAIDNSKFFCCDGLWQGIVLEYLSYISTYNNTEIEDAEKAIFASGLCGLSIQQTTFNRNRVGVELETPFPNIWVPGPLVWVFADNRFTCNAPLNGTTEEITEAGVKLKNAYLYTFKSGLNRFLDLKYGIYSEGDFSHIGASRLHMQRIKKDGIYMKEGSVNLADSWLYACEEKGINIETAKLVNVKNTGFTMATTLTTERRIGIYINKFALNSDIQINGINFNADMEGTDNKVTGVYLQGGNIASGTKIRIGGNSIFGFRAKDSHGVYFDGSFPPGSITEIWGNRFKVSNTTQNPGSGRPTGIGVVSEDMNNLSIKWNAFTSYTVHTLPPDEMGPLQWSFGVHLRNNVHGTNNEVSSNGFNYEVQPLQVGLYVDGFQNTKYCSNTFSGYGFTTGAILQSTSTGTDFTGNYFDFAGFDALLISTGTQIGTQLHKGNQWHNLFGVEPVFHARCQSNPLVNKFIVHTQQSTCASEGDPCFNPFHPRKIEPDLMDEFFQSDPGGIPSEGCTDAFTGGGTDELDRQIAQGTFESSPDNPALNWVLQRYLYRKFKDSPALTSEHTSYPSFVTVRESTTVGKFHDIRTAIENALKADLNVDAPSAQAISDINTLMESMTTVDEAIEQQGLTETLKQQKENLMLQIHGQHWIYDSLRTTHEVQVSANLQTAYDLNQAIATTQTYETNEKTVNYIRLRALMQQGGALTEGQILTLQAIAQQLPEQGGPAVYAALGMLQECVKPQVSYQYPGVPDQEYLNYAKAVQERAAVPVFGAIPGISISPNPASTSFFVRNPQENTGTLTMLDISGRVWLQQPFSGQEVQINLKTGTPAGIYVLRFDIAGGSSIFKKLIVQSN